MRKILKNTAKTTQYLYSLPKIYLLACWARYGVREHYFTGKYTKEGIPLVYHYEDHNGFTDQFELMPITQTTTGSIVTWGFSEQQLQVFADQLNNIDKKDKRLRIVERIMLDNSNYVNTDYGAYECKFYIDGCTQYLNAQEKLLVEMWINEINKERKEAEEKLKKFSNKKY